MAKLLVDADTARQFDQAQFELNSWIDTSPFEDLLELSIDRCGEGEAVLSVPFKLKHANGGGVMHGGAMTTLADTAVAMAIKTLLPEGTVFATTDLQISFLAPVKQGKVTARAQVEGPDGRTFHGVARLYDQAGVQVAKFTSTFRVARGQGFADS